MLLITGLSDLFVQLPITMDKIQLPDCWPMGAGRPGSCLYGASQVCPVTVPVRLALRCCLLDELSVQMSGRN